MALDEVVNEASGGRETWRDILVIDRIRANINVEVDCARHVMCNLRLDHCVHVQPIILQTQHEKGGQRGPNGF
jgi:hypothetical protein